MESPFSTSSWEKLRRASTISSSQAESHISALALAYLALRTSSYVKNPQYESDSNNLSLFSPRAPHILQKIDLLEVKKRQRESADFSPVVMTELGSISLDFPVTAEAKISSASFEDDAEIVFDEQLTHLPISLILGSRIFDLGEGITEIVGTRGQHESYLCHFVAATATLPRCRGGASANVFYFQSSPTRFRALTVAQFANAVATAYHASNNTLANAQRLACLTNSLGDKRQRSCNSVWLHSYSLQQSSSTAFTETTQNAVIKACENIRVISTPTLSEVMTSLERLERDYEFETNSQSVIIIDDIFSLIENELGVFGDSTESITTNRKSRPKPSSLKRFLLLSHFASLVQRINAQYNVRILVANAGPVYHADKEKSDEFANSQVTGPTFPFGVGWSHYVNTRFHLTSNTPGEANGFLTITPVKSPHHPPLPFSFDLSSNDEVLRSLPVVRLH